MTDLKFENKKIYFGLIGVSLLAFCTVFLSKSTFLYLVQEDGIFEWAGAILFMMTSVLFFVLYFKKDKFYKTEDRDYFSTFRKRIFFLLLGLLFFFLLGEEISWGQRILGFETPEGIEARNMQDEFNFHNLDTFHLWDGENNRKSGLKALFTAKKIFVYIFVTYLFLLPLGVKFIGFLKNLTDKLYLPIPDIGLGILFIINVLFFKFFKIFSNGEDPVMRGLGEIEEFNFALILFFLPFVWMRFFKKDFANL